MFRKPRSDVNGAAELLGRPPSPSSRTSAQTTSATTVFVQTEPTYLNASSQSAPPPNARPFISSMASRTATTRLPLAGGNATRRVVATTPSKGKGKTADSKPNQSILSFFKKTDPPPASSILDGADGVENGLFVDDANWQQVETAQDETDETDLGTAEQVTGKVHGKTTETVASQVPTPPRDDDIYYTTTPTTRFNEDGTAVKRRKTGGQLLGRSLDPAEETKAEEGGTTEVSNQAQRETLNRLEGMMRDEAAATNSTKDLESLEGIEGQHTPGADESPEDQKISPVIDTPPILTRESTSAMFDDLGGEDYLDDEDLAEMGEEFLERRFAEEQRRLEREAGDYECDEKEEGPVIKSEEVEEAREACTLDSDTPPCPICNIALAGITDEQASEHVNNCLDGRPSTLPKPAIQPPGVKAEPNMPAKRFMKATIPRPGQQNPFILGGDPAAGAGGSNGSAFSKLMSGHAEDSAWAAAAAHETASRGKPAFKRTCPFYKILPGFNICVDAFRYGAVQGCSAYFLSHFHSDHYIGLTSSWCHGPIYCSKITANLVRQQLRVDAKYVVPLEFEKKVEVPGTNGVHVTMIPANHCPGSSLFLYEKVVASRPKMRTHRVLHCGDFRACPAHVHHPLLRPDVVDAVTGKRGEQKLDVCYLDTTYLTPKYAFPLQHEVIQACADMCISLSKDKLDEGDDWERMKRERAGAGMVKFVRSDSQGNNIVGKELDEDGNAISASTEAPKKSRGRLLVVVGTYSIGKERICLGVAKALNSKIYATSGKQRICAALEDPELTARLTSNPLEAQVHMQMIMEIRPETLADYLASYKPHFSRIVGFRPSGWNYRPPNSRFTDNPLVSTVLHSDNWKSRYSMAELMPQRGSTREASCFGVPYSEHSSFRELTMFCCSLRIDKIIPTVNIGSAKSRERMKAWFEKWDQEKRKNGLYKIVEGASTW